MFEPALPNMPLLERPRKGEAFLSSNSTSRESILSLNAVFSFSSSVFPSSLSACELWSTAYSCCTTWICSFRSLITPICVSAPSTSGIISVQLLDAVYHRPRISPAHGWVIRSEDTLNVSYSVHNTAFSSPKVVLKVFDCDISRVSTFR